MELKEYIKNEFDGLKRVSTRILNTVTQQELMWRPACGCNSMGLILFHVARSEDSFIHAMLQNKPVWESGNGIKMNRRSKSEPILLSTRLMLFRSRI
jgi:hypothetical protein